MISFIGRSIIQKIVTLFFVSIVSFLIIHLAPGKPSQVDPLNPKFTPEVVERFRKEFHLDKPLHIQYLYFYRNLFTGKTVSWKDNQSVLTKIWERFLNSLPLFIVGTILTWTLSFPVGIRSAISRGGIYDRSATFISYLLISIPGFFFAYIMIIFVVTRFHVPVIGMETFGIGRTGLYSDRPGQRTPPGPDTLQTCAPKCAAPFCDHVRPDSTRVDWRFCYYRIHFFLARHGPHGL